MQSGLDYFADQKNGGVVMMDGSLIGAIIGSGVLIGGAIVSGFWRIAVIIGNNIKSIGRLEGKVVSGGYLA